MKTRRVLICILFATTAYFSIARLGSPELWNDEAHVAVFARNFLQTGRWSAWDGRNLAGADRNGIYLTPQLTTVLPQLDFVVTAASFRLFGVSTWSARLFFGLAGIASVALLFLWIKIEAPNQPELRLYAAALLGMSAPWLLYVRTCRYYSLAAMLLLGCLIGYAKYFQTKNWRWLGLMTASAVLLFQASSLICAASLLALALRHFLLNASSCKKRDWLLCCGSGLLFILLSLPYLFAYTLPYKAACKFESGGSSAPWLLNTMTLLWWNIREMNATNLMPWTIAACLVACWIAINHEVLPQEINQALAGWTCLAGGFLMGLVLLSPQSIETTTLADIRYLSPAIPIFAALGGIVLAVIHKKSVVAGSVMLAMLLTTTLPGIWPSSAWSFRWLLPAFIKEIHQPYPTSCSALAQYLHERANKDDRVVVVPDFYYMPLQFYVGDHILIRGLMDSKSPLPADKINHLDSTLYAEHLFPEWIVSCGLQPTMEATLQFYMRSFDSEEGSEKSYNYELQADLPVYWGESYRPELPWHSFGPRSPKTDDKPAAPWYSLEPETFDMRNEAVYVFKRQEGEQP